MKFKDIPQFTKDGNYQFNIPLKYLSDKIREWQEDPWYNLQLNPNFQRGHVWTEEQQIKYVEYLLRGGKCARIIYLNKPSWQGEISGDYDDFVCVDGLQRITAVLRFLNNEIKAFGYYYREYEDKLPFRVDLLININNLKTEREVLQWYVDLNEGGTPHTQMEIDKVKQMIKDIDKKTEEI